MFADFDHEPTPEKLTRRQRAERLTSGRRGADYLTDPERQLLGAIRAQGLEISRSFMVNERSGQRGAHPRAIVQGGRSWSHSID